METIDFRGFFRRLLVFIGYFFLALAASTLPIDASKFAASKGFSQAIQVIITLLTFLLSCGIVVFLYKDYLRVSNKKAANPLPGLKDIAIIICLYLLMSLCVYGLKLLMNQVYQQVSTANAAVLNQGVLEAGRTVSNISYILIAPLVEELVQRGLFSYFLFENLDRKWVAPLGAFVFAMSHRNSNPISFLIFFVSGLFYFLAFYRRGNIWDAIYLHMLNNLIAQIL